MHLVLPPAPTPTPTSAACGSSAQERPHVPVQQRDSQHFSNRFSQPIITRNTQGIRYRGSGTSPGLSEAEIGLALQRNIETIRRQVELQARGRWPLRQGLQETPATGHSRPFSPQTTSPSLSQQSTWQRTPQNLFHPPSLATAQSPWTTSRASVATIPVDLSAPDFNSARVPGDPSTHVPLPENRIRLEVLRQQITLCEAQLGQGIPPPIDLIIRIRTQLFNVLDDQYRNPLAERDGVIESLLSRVFNIYTRADQLRIVQPTTSLQDHRTNAGLSVDTSRAPAYLLLSPSGYQALLTSPNTTQVIQTSLASIRSGQTAVPAPVPGSIPAANTNPNPNPVILENAVRQAVLNQRLRNNGQMGLARNVRRIWLFIRLYFFCYMFSEPGTWSRFFLVTLAVMISLLSETGAPHYLYGLLVAPVQRHLEGLMQFGPDEHLQPQPTRTGNGPSETQTQPGQTTAETPAIARNGRTELRQNLRRVERSLALFIASFIPGVGERHVEARNAAEAARIAAERARAEEEERRRQQEEAEQDGGEQSREEENTRQGPEEGEGTRQDSTEQSVTAETGTEIHATNDTP